METLLPSPSSSKMTTGDCGDASAGSTDTTTFNNQDNNNIIAAITNIQNIQIYTNANIKTPK